MTADKIYQGERGGAYHERRSRLRSAPVQAARARLFADIACPDLVLLDFGCGTGGVAASLPASRRIGVEISEHARAEATERLDEVVESLEAVPDDSVDRVISFHALEHVADPGGVLRELRRVLRPGGLMKIVVPCHMPVFDRFHRRWSAGDMDFHLYAWTPQTFGNLAQSCGFEVNEGLLLPASRGGLLGRITGGATWTKTLKAARSGRFHTVVLASA